MKKRNNNNNHGVVRVVAAPVWPLQRDAKAFYGDPLDPNFAKENIVTVLSPWPLFCGTAPVSHIAIHRKCSDSLTRVLSNIWETLNHDIAKIKALRYDQFDGSFVVRNKRGGSSLSMHSYGCALDFDSKDNPFHGWTHNNPNAPHLFTADSLITKAFEAEGAVWGGSWGVDYDFMHYQFAKIHS